MNFEMIIFCDDNGAFFMCAVFLVHKTGYLHTLMIKGQYGEYSIIAYQSYLDIEREKNCKYFKSSIF